MLSRVRACLVRLGLYIKPLVYERPPHRAKKENYTVAFRQEAVRLVESGLSQREVTRRLDLNYTSLQAWLKRYGTAVYSQMRRKLFTLPRSTG